MEHQHYNHVNQNDKNNDYYNRSSSTTTSSSSSTTTTTIGRETKTTSADSHMTTGEQSGTAPELPKVSNPNVYGALRAGLSRRHRHAPGSTHHQGSQRTA